ncbi:hypothetical protein CPEBRM1_ABPJDJAI_01091 [Companilactobacillus paralimentarius]|uniref:hypothetical protein n=1 Tax=Companilactobacillus paralimentarius TaxID=83526 RepID=UPI00384E247E
MQKKLWNIRVEGISNNSQSITQKIKLFIGDSTVELDLESLSVSGFDNQSISNTSEGIKEIFEIIEKIANKKSKN